jgi:hypothetical protein
MGKKSGSAAAQRAKKKHEKDQARKKTLASKQQARPVPAARPPVPEPRAAWSPEVEGISGLAARHGCSFFAAARAMSTETGDERKLPAAVWTPPRVERLSTREIEARLSQLGIHTSPEGFVGATRPGGSAVAYAREAWLAALPPESDVHARDFACLAACELWKRWRPDTASQEMLLEVELLSAIAAERGNSAKGIECGFRLWSLLRPLLTPAMRTTEAAELLFGEGPPGALFNWASDFSMAAMNAALDDKEAGRRGAEVLAEVLAQFPDEPEGWRLPLVCDRARLLYETGAREDSERLLREQIAAYPDQAGAYVTLADLWASRASDDLDPVRRALALLEEATAKPVVDAKDWDLEARVQALRDRLGPRR